MSGPMTSARQRVIDAFVALGGKGDVHKISAHTGMAQAVVAGAFSELRKRGRIRRIGTFGHGRGSYGVYCLLDEALIPARRRPAGPPPRIWASVIHGGL